jgi:hypothetical protein
MTADLRGAVIVCAQTGTVLAASQCYILTDSQTTDRFFDEDSMSDAECGQYAREVGRSLSDVVTLRAVLPGEPQPIRYRQTAAGHRIAWDEPGENF